jgi:hypothetical protein
MEKQRKRKPKSKNYFTQDTENAIIRYNKEEDSEVRSRIYRDELQHAFFKLTQNLIHTFKFYYTEESNLEDLQHEVITFLLSKLHLFDPSKGAKAYSYFGTIAKRYLIASNEKNYKKRMQTVSFDAAAAENDKEDSSIKLPNMTQELIITPSHHVDQLSIFLDAYVEHCSDNIYKLFPLEDEAQIADAILELFRKRESISIFNKKALYIYIREMIDAKTPKITKVANDLKALYKKSYTHYLEYGEINFRIR